MNIKVKDMSQKERPREKALISGIESLSNRDLLAILLRSGTKGTSAMQLADDILMKSGSLCGLLKMKLADLMSIRGIKEAKAIQLLASFEISRRIAYDEVCEIEVQIEKPKTLVDWLNQQIGFTSQEHFVVIFLDSKNKIITYKTLFKGSLNASIVHPREVFKEAITFGAAKIIVAHNHPSGDVEPSEQDILTTNNLKETGEIVGIPLLDHLIVGGNKYISFRQKLLID